MPKVLIQAGHEGRTSGATGAVANGLREIDLTPIVANEATAILRSNGIEVVRVKADGLSEVRDLALAISIHFDGPASGGAQAIYDDDSDSEAAWFFRDMYRQVYGFKWLADNTTPLRDSTGYSRYYGFRYWFTTDAEMVLELGTLGDPAFANFLKQDNGAPVKWLGDCVARFVLKRLQYMYAAGRVVDMVPYELSPYNPRSVPSPPVVPPLVEPSALEDELAASQAKVIALAESNADLREELELVKLQKTDLALRIVRAKEALG